LFTLFLAVDAPPAFSSGCGSLFKDPLSFKLQQAEESDFSQIIKIGNQHRNEMGQVLKHNLRVGIQEESLWVAKSSSGEVLGFVLWHLRKDGWSTVYDIGVFREFGGLGVGRALLCLAFFYPEF
jgi:ribosomal protein S18 acetylase RimI-like enzyme